jgi:hypothetical protein
MLNFGDEGCAIGFVVFVRFSFALLDSLLLLSFGFDIFASHV